MTIGNYCQICGERKKISEVKGEAHGLVVTAPCMMDKVFGDPPAPADEVRSMLKYCAVCGTEQAEPPPEHCESCGAPLTAQTGADDLSKLGAPASPGSRVLAFAIDLAIIVLLCFIAVRGIGSLQSSSQTTGHDPAVTETSPAPGDSEGVAESAEESSLGEAEEIDVYTVGMYASVLIVFILYHGLFVGFVGRTPGKMAAGIKVVLKNGSEDVSLGRAVLRSALYLFTVYVVPIGWLPLVFQEEPSNWLKLIEADAMFHNSLTDTVVIKPGEGSQ
jgi:uncharacterized RDD family membrane protein YckC